MNSTLGQTSRHRSARNRKRHRLALARRRLQTETLENRVLLAGDTLAWHNADLPFDTNGDGRVSSHDAQLVLDDLNEHGSRDVDPSVIPPGLIDVTGDGVITARDGMQIVEHLTQGSGEGDAKVQVRLAVTATDSLDPLTTIGPNDEFVLRAFVTDLTDPAEGVFGAYIDVMFDATLADATGDVVHADDFGNGVAGDLTVDGTFDEVGSFAGSFLGTGDAETLLFSVPMTALGAVGTLSFAGDPADVLPNHETTLFGENDAVLADEIMFVDTSVAIVAEGGPTSVDDSYGGTEDTTLEIDAANGVLANDLPAEAALTASVVTGPENGSLTLSPDGSFVYQPNAHFNGSDSFTYVANDGVVDSIASTVTLLISAVNDAPIAVDDSYSVAVDQSLSVPAGEGLLANDVDFEFAVPGNTVTVVTDQIEGVENGTLTARSDGSFDYTPNVGFVGDETFTYFITDQELVSERATVTISVTGPVTGGPEATDDSFSVTEDTLLTIAAPGVLANDTGDGEISAELVTPPENGTLVLNPDGSFEYTPNTNFAATDTFTYQATDGTLSDSANVSIVVEPVNDPPVTVDDVYVGNAGEALVVSAEDGVLANDSDPDGDTLTVVLAREPANGMLDLNPDGSFTYLPNEGFVGVDEFIYAVPDESLSRFATATIEIRPVETGEDLVAIRVAATNVEGEVLTTVQSGESFELRVFVDDLSAEPQRGVFAAYTDVEWDSTLAVVAGPIQYNDTYPNGTRGSVTTAGLIDEGGAFAGLAELGGDERLLFVVPMQATGGGDLTFTTNPADDLPFGDVLLFATQADAVPTDRIDYGTISLTVEGLSEPVAANDAYDVDDGVLTVAAEEGVLANDIRIDDGPFTAVLETEPQDGTLELNDDGSFTYTANVGFVGIDGFSYRASSGGVVSEPATVTLSVGDPGPSSLSGSIYFDTNNSGVRESHEHAFGGVDVTLTGTDFLGNAIERTATTSTSGTYSFGDLLPGEYVVTQDQPAVVVDGIDAQGGIASATNDSFSVNLRAGTDLADLDFGERGLRPGYFGNRLNFASTPAFGASVAIGTEEAASWHCIDFGWDGYRSIEAAMSADLASVAITAVALNGDVFTASVSVHDPNVIVMGTAEEGILVRLGGTSADYPLQRVSNAAAVDAAFAE